MILSRSCRHKHGTVTNLPCIPTGVLKELGQKLRDLTARPVLVQLPVGDVALCPPHGVDCAGIHAEDGKQDGVSFISTSKHRVFQLSRTRIVCAVWEA
jgi:hypothetical protein